MPKEKKYNNSFSLDLTAFAALSLIEADTCTKGKNWSSD
jgi:hypothetical protein